jgi:GNAT superfamily N-acetyltransferase
MNTALNIRLATPADSAIITEHRHKMFRDNDFATEEVLARMDEAFEPWVHERLSDSRYLGLLVEERNAVVAGAGVFFCDFPPHWRHAEATRAYVLNVYTDPEVRGRGLAKRLMRHILEECRKRGVSTIVLHASPQGRPLYESLGFSQSDEMMIGLTI